MMLHRRSSWKLNAIPFILVEVICLIKGNLQPLRCQHVDFLLELRKNNISIDGIRALALELESTGTRGIEHVYIHRDGMIEAIGAVVSTLPSSEGNSPENSQSNTIVRIDARENCAIVQTQENVSKASGEALHVTPGSNERNKRATTLNTTMKRQRRPTKRSNQHSLRSDLLRDVCDFFHLIVATLNC